MFSSQVNAKAKHLDGGNFFDDMRIDIAESHSRFDTVQRQIQVKKRSKIANLLKLYFTGFAIKISFYEFLVVNGLKRRWLNEFQGYWSSILNGRPFHCALDFFMLSHDYRKRQQHTSQLEWSDPTQHLLNWQHPSQLYATFHKVTKCAINPIRCISLWKRIPKGAFILEYGCSLAPYYYCYREFFSHLRCRWLLADIPNFPFHYAKYLYWNDVDVDFVTINAEGFSDPLGKYGNFDVIILTEVLEHLDDPVFVVEYLLKRLKVGGMLVFDYIKSEGKGLDHPKALAMRDECIRKIMYYTKIVQGNMERTSEHIGLCIVQKI